MRIVCIGAHPDDIEIGTAGTMAMHKERGDEVHGILCTLGGVRGSPEGREKEAREAADILGFRLHSLDYPASKLNKSSEEFVLIISKLIKDIAPDRIYTHSPLEYHQVHTSVANSVFEASKAVDQVLCYEVTASTTTHFRPNAFVEITEFIEPKLRSLAAHKSQIADRFYIQPNVIRSIANTRYVWGKVGTDPNGLAEAFQVHRFVL